MKTYDIEVPSKILVTVEAESESEALHQALGTADMYEGIITSLDFENAKIVN